MAGGNVGKGTAAAHLASAHAGRTGGSSWLYKRHRAGYLLSGPGLAAGNEGLRPAGVRALDPLTSKKNGRVGVLSYRRFAPLSANLLVL